MFAFVVNDAIVEAPVALPRSARRVAPPNPGDWVMVLGSVEDQEACGYFVVTEFSPPVVTAAQRAEFTVEMVGGVPTQVWTVRAETPLEAERRVRDQNRIVLGELATLTTKMGELKEFLVDPDVVAAESQPNNTALSVSQQNRFNKAVARQLRREANAVLRLYRHVFSSTNPSLLDDISDV